MSAAGGEAVNWTRQHDRFIAERVLCRRVYDYTSGVMRMEDGGTLIVVPQFDRDQMWAERALEHWLSLNKNRRPEDFSKIPAGELHQALYVAAGGPEA